MFDKPFGNSVLPRLLALCYSCAVSLRNGLFDLFPSLAWNAPIPVISIGAIHAGGTGKTPLTILIGRMVAEMGKIAIVASRGYRRHSRHTVVLAPDAESSWEDIGDEPLMMHNNLPYAWLAIGADRAAAISSTSRNTPRSSVVLLDDGFQHRRVARALDIICLPADPFGEHLLPAGVLREPLSSLRRAAVACLIGSPDQAGLAEQSAVALSKRFPHLLICILRQEPGSWINLATGEHAGNLPFARPFLMCGIAWPQRFEAMVRGLEGEISGKRFFEDHHVYSVRDFETDSIKSAQGIVTTEKDAVKLKRLKLVPEIDIWYLTLRLSFCNPSNQSDFKSLIQKTITP